MKNGALWCLCNFQKIWTVSVNEILRRCFNCQIKFPSVTDYQLNCLKCLEMCFGNIVRYMAHWHKRIREWIPIRRCGLVPKMTTVAICLRGSARLGVQCEYFFIIQYSIQIRIGTGNRFRVYKWAIRDRPVWKKLKRWQMELLRNYLIIGIITELIFCVINMLFVANLIQYLSPKIETAKLPAIACQW